MSSDPKWRWNSLTAFTGKRILTFCGHEREMWKVGHLFPSEDEFTLLWLTSGWFCSPQNSKFTPRQGETARPMLTLVREQFGRGAQEQEAVHASVTFFSWMIVMQDLFAATRRTALLFVLLSTGDKRLTAEITSVHPEHTPLFDGEEQRFSLPFCFPVDSLQDFSPEGILQLGICRMHHLLAMSLVWLDIFRIFSTECDSLMQEKEKCFWTNPAQSCDILQFFFLHVLPPKLPSYENNPSTPTKN